MNKYSIVSKIRKFSKSAQLFWVVHYGIIAKVVADEYEDDYLKSGLDAYDYFSQKGVIQSFNDFDIGSIVFDLKKEGLDDNTIIKRLMTESKGTLNPNTINAYIDKYNAMRKIHQEVIE